MLSGKNGRLRVKFKKTLMVGMYCLEIWSTKNKSSLMKKMGNYNSQTKNLENLQ